MFLLGSECALDNIATDLVFTMMCEFSVLEQIIILLLTRPLSKSIPRVSLHQTFFLCLIESTEKHKYL